MIHHYHQHQHHHHHHHRHHNHHHLHRHHLYHINSLVISLTCTHHPHHYFIGKLDYFIVSGASKRGWTGMNSCYLSFNYISYLSYRSIHISIYPSFNYLSYLPIHPSIYLSIHLSNVLSIMSIDHIYLSILLTV